MTDLARELESLRRENARLRKLLKLTDAELAPTAGTQGAWFDKALGPVDAASSPQSKVAFYAAMFRARTDVYAITWENARSGKSGWVPAVEGGWRQGTADTRRRLPLTPDVLAAHLIGDVHIGLYPMLRGDQTCWLAADFDGPAAMLEALAYLKAARALSAPAALEVSRSGVGAHVWIFFTDPVSAAAARQVGTGLVREAIAIRGRMDLRAYDRLFPSQDLLIDGAVRIPGSELSPPLYATLKHAASTYNPDFYERQRRRQSTWNVPRIICSYDETLDDHLVLPRGLLDTATKLIEESGSRIRTDDRRAAGTVQEWALNVQLAPGQQAAVEALLPQDLGLLVARPGSGKTVMACAVIAARSTPTLVLVDRKTLADQWRRQIRDLLGIKAGQLGGGHSMLTGVIDVATLQTLARREGLGELLSGYGLVVVDECHHVPAAAFESAVRTIPARYWLGLTATPYRRDGLDDLIGFQLGPVRHTRDDPDPDTLDGAGSDRPRPVLIVHPTRFRFEEPVDLSEPGAITRVHRALAESDTRNQQILTDVADAQRRGRHCLVLAQRTAHVDHLAAALRDRGLAPVVLNGGMGARERAAALARLVPDNAGPPLLVVATGHFVGEGFDCPALDTLFLAGPVSFKGRLVQYTGRILRTYPGKQTAEVHDYHDVEVPVLTAALAKRAPGYLSLGFPDPRKA